MKAKIFPRKNERRRKGGNGALSLDFRTPDRRGTEKQPGEQIRDDMSRREMYSLAWILKFVKQEKEKGREESGENKK